MLYSTTFGAEAHGFVIDKFTYKDDEDGRIYKIDVDYKWEHKTMSHKFPVDRESYNSFSDGDAIDVRFLPAFREWTLEMKSAKDAEYEKPDIQAVLFIGFFTICWNGIVGIFVMVLYVWPLVEWWLLRFGKPTIGVVVNKSHHSDSDSSTHTIEYAYDPNSKEVSPFNRKEQVNTSTGVTAEVYAKVQSGDRITVLHLKRWPHINTVFEFSGLELAK